jgi:ABC-type transport system involved in cytochrome c biogenesis permease subunit
MATNILDNEMPLDHAAGKRHATATWQTALIPLASLKISVVLFALSIFLILAGTLAQAEKDIWEVLHQYFRCWFAWIEFRVFLPPAWFPDVNRESICLQLGQFKLTGFFFPGGWLIGTVMAINLLSAHLLRFKVQAKGMSRVGGTVLILIGVVLTWLVIETGNNRDGVAIASNMSWSTIWIIFRALILGSSLFLMVWASLLPQKKKLQFFGLFGLSLVLGIAGAMLFALGDRAQLDDSGMRILWQLLKATFAGLVLLQGCYVLFGKRAGVVLLHAGILLMMSNEIVVATLHKEAQMNLAEGDFKNYIEDIRTYELVWIDHSNPEKTREIAIPKEMLLAGRTIDDPRLPVIITIDQNLPHTALVKKDTPNGVVTSQGLGTGFAVLNMPEVTGTEDGGKINMPTIIAKLTNRGAKEDMGTYAFPLKLGVQEIFDPIKVGDKSWDVALRFQRTYKDYTIQLVDVRKDDYMGTNVVKNYSSDIRLVDPKLKEDDVHHIWMNNPLRFAGETFYQQGYMADPETGKEYTTLQIVSNEGWMIPYVSCMIVAVGLLAHFLVTLSRYLNRVAEGRFHTIPVPDAATLNTGDPAPLPMVPAPWHDTTLTWNNTVAICLIVFVVCGYLYSKASVRPAKPGQMNYAKFGQIPVVYEGRVKPLDTLARNSLRILSNWETYPEPVPENEQSSSAKMMANLFGNGEVTRREPAIKWMTDLIIDPVRARDTKVIRIDDEDLLKFLKLERRKSHLYSIADLVPQMDPLMEESNKIHELKDAKQPLNHRQKKILELEQKIGVINLLTRSFSPPDLGTDKAKIMDDLISATRTLSQLRERNPPSIIPIDHDQKHWLPFAIASTMEIVRPMGEINAQYKALQEAFFTGLTGLSAEEVTKLDPKANPYTKGFTSIVLAYVDNDANKFNTSIDEYLDLIKTEQKAVITPAWLKFETNFNQFSPFFYAGVVYLIAFILTAFSWMFWPRTLGRAVVWILFFTFLVHSYAIIARIMISGRPPVTNLYSSAVFIGWAGVFGGIMMELVNRRGFGNIIGSVAGFATMWIAFGLSGDGETMKVLEAVLDTQFWLSTHVVCVSLGYTATYLAGFLGVIYILRGALTTSMNKDLSQTLTRMTYGTLCFALFFSFVGTVLGGLWADDSWGRFWGWDPKENGALIIVLWNILVLHAYWDRMVRDRGLALLAVGGNLATSWSWFGVNQLGVGLHSYGFTEGVLRNLVLFALTQALVIAIGLIPLKYWFSGRKLSQQ